VTDADDNTTAADRTPGRIDYRLSQPLALRLMGGFLAVLGGAVFVVTVLVGVLSLPIVVLGISVVLAVVLVFVVGTLLTRRAWMVRLDDAGYRVRYVRGVGRAQARWADVEDAVVTKVAGEPCVVLRLRAGGTTTIPVRVLGVDPEEFVRELRQRLDHGRGYKRLR
jgi:hypothetical protein